MSMVITRVTSTQNESSQVDTPFKKEVSSILRRIIENDATYVLSRKYIRWGKVERDLWELESLINSKEGR